MMARASRCRPLVPAAALALLALAGCTPRVVVPDAERERIHAALDGQSRWTRVALYVSPLFGDHARLLLLDAPANEVDLLRDAGDKVIPPPAPERILPPGTAVRVEKVEFPSPMVIAGRVVMSPRYHPWVVLRVAGEDRPFVVVLSSGSATAESLLDEVDRVLTRDDPSRLYAGLPREQREAVARKELVEGASTRAVEMAWGVPERIRIDRPATTEEWSWPGGRRRAWFLDEKLQRWEK
jgi:hypothetical protein